MNFKVIKYRRVTWVGHVECMGDDKNIQNFRWNTLGEEIPWKKKRGQY
jgi:hypothetical protein